MDDADPIKVEEAMAEGVKIHHRLGVKNILTDNGAVAGIALKDVEKVFDEQNRFAPIYFEDRVSRMDCDIIIEAIGSIPDLSSFESIEVKKSDKNTIAVDPLTLQTSVPWIFAGGDMMWRDFIGTQKLPSYTKGQKRFRKTLLPVSCWAKKRKNLQPEQKKNVFCLLSYYPFRLRLGFFFS